MTDIADSDTPAPLRVAAADIPLPPPDMWAELVSEGSGRPSSSEVESLAEAKVADLEYVGDEKPFRVIPLRWPFRLDGRVVSVVTVRALTVQEIGDFADRLPNPEAYRRTDVYGLMCGLPGDVIRALRGADGRRVTDACLDFLLPGDEVQGG